MLRNLLFLGLFLITFSGLNCSSIPHANQHQFAFSQFELLKVDQSTQNQVLALIGPPNVKIASNESEQKMEGWLYVEERHKSRPRIALGFDPISHILKVKTWRVWQGEPEKDLNRVKNLYVSGNFKHSDAPWTNPHSQPDEEFYEDGTKGFLITFSYAQQEVKSISWSTPESRKLSLTATTSH